MLRERVTSKGGTTYAAITSLDDADVKATFVGRDRAPRSERAGELGEEFGRGSTAARLQRSAQPSRDTGEHGEAQPVVEPKGLEAAVARALADQRAVPQRLRRRDGDADEERPGPGPSCAPASAQTARKIA